MGEARDGETTRVTDKGQTTIPKSLREKYSIEPGDEVIWIEDEDGIRLVRAERASIRGLLLSGDADEEVREEAAERLREDLRESRDDEWAIDP